VAGETLEEHASERVLIGAPVDRLAVDLLRREIREGTRRAAEPGCRGVDLDGDPEVGQVRVIRVADQDVRGLDVAVHQPARVRRVERGGYLRGDRDRALRLQRPVGEQRAQVAAVDVAHRDVELAVGLVGVVHGHNVRVVEGGGEARLA